MEGGGALIGRRAHRASRRADVMATLWGMSYRVGKRGRTSWSVLEGFHREKAGWTHPLTVTSAPLAVHRELERGLYLWRLSYFSRRPEFRSQPRCPTIHNCLWLQLQVLLLASVEPYTFPSLLHTHTHCKSCFAPERTQYSACSSVGCLWAHLSQCFAERGQIAVKAADWMWCNYSVRWLCIRFRSSVRFSLLVNGVSNHRVPSYLSLHACEASWVFSHKDFHLIVYKTPIWILLEHFHMITFQWNLLSFWL